MPSQPKRNRQPGTAASKINFHFPYGTVSLRERTRLKNFITSLFRREGTSFTTMDYIFCSDEYLLEINKGFLRHNYFTDIITFNLGAQKDLVAGEVYISIDRIKVNAKDYNQPFQRELHRVIFHGALHLCGYKDKSPRDFKLMKQMEDKYLGLYFKGK
ncbi:MAG: rRNA maturation RNase YbeY [Bacteroidetes bacterium]|nr:rRNA maturation RNase YbeY [Bacteroidota bacterium]